MKCDICNREQVETGQNKIWEIGDSEFEIIGRNYEIVASNKGINICYDCMNTYNKIHSLQYGLTFNWLGNDYFSDGRNLKDDYVE